MASPLLDPATLLQLRGELQTARSDGALITDRVLAVVAVLDAVLDLLATKVKA